jgi:hypothetical protein
VIGENSLPSALAEFTVLSPREGVTASINLVLHQITWELLQAFDLQFLGIPAAHFAENIECDDSVNGGWGSHPKLK